MRYLSKIARHADLVTGMMTRLVKSPICAAPHPTRNQVERLRAMTIACTRCENPDACAALQASALTLDTPPLFCRNRTQFHALPDAKRV